jgi:hypothetical protein
MHVKPSFFRARQAAQSKWASDHTCPQGKSSMGVLLDWLAAPGNYDRWRSRSKSDMSLGPLAEEIAQLLHAQGLRHRTASDVQAKVAELEHSYQEASERLASTKRELAAAQGTPAERNLHHILERHCRYFALLQPIMQSVEHEVDIQPKKRPKLSTKRRTTKVVAQPVAVASPPARAASPPPARLRPRSPSPVKKRSHHGLRERRGIATDLVWDFDSESAEPSTPPTARPVRKSKSRAMESISVMQLQQEEEERGRVRCRLGRRDFPPGPVKKRPALSSIDEIDLEKARVELTLRQLELQMARDKALVTRARARSQLLEQGVSRREVDRLMPLDV